MVEGHPFLNAKPEKRLTRKALSNSPSTRKKINNKTKTNELKILSKEDSQSKEDRTDISIDETQSQNIDITASQDIIESSQDSSVTTISVRSTKNSSRKVPIVALEKINNVDKIVAKKQDGIDNSSESDKLDKLEKENDLANSIDKDDTVLPQNKTAEEQSNIIDLTENMDTEPIEINDDEIHEISDKQIVEIKNDDLSMEVDSQGIATADTQPLDPNFTLDNDETAVKEKPIACNDKADDSNVLITNDIKNDISINTVTDDDATNASITTSNETTKTITDLTVCKSSQEEAASSPFKDEEQRKKDFLNNTLEISPIKILSPVRDERTPSPETSNDYVVIKLASPVQCNGEPIEKCNSPEIFTEDKVSPTREICHLPEKK
ncbi:unnamed protein product [Colias eurytheme]|nr:unnamed protein product [Colias eurytheme]